MIRRRILLGALLGVLFAVGWWAGRGRAAGDLYANTDLFLEVLHAVQTSYVDQVQVKPLIQGGLHGMVKDLDPYSQYLDEHEAAQMNASLSGEFDGVGLMSDIKDGYPVVLAPIEGSPAWDAGVLPGDIITKIDGHSTFQLSFPEVANKLRGDVGTKVALTLFTKGAHEEHDVTLTRRRITVRPVPYAFVTEQRVGYLRLAHFTATAGHELRAGLDSLRREGAKSIVLDLRGDPGGLVDQAIDVAGAFLPEGALIVSTKGRLTSAAKRYVAAKGRVDSDLPMAVLIDGGSASASEIVTGALQDLDRAVVIGETSFGKGVVQDIYPIRRGGGALKLTTAYYYTPSGRSIHKLLPKPVDTEDDSAGADSTGADSSAARPAFHTKAGRLVYGGGGITPDIAVAADSSSARVRVGGGLALVREALAKDPVFLRAAALLAKAHSPRDVFAAMLPASTPAKAPEAPRLTSRPASPKH